MWAPETYKVLSSRCQKHKTKQILILEENWAQNTLFSAFWLIMCAGSETEGTLRKCKQRLREPIFKRQRCTLGVRALECADFLMNAFSNINIEHMAKS